MSKKSNSIPQSNDQLLAQGDLVGTALGTHEGVIGLKQNTAAVVQAEVAAFRKAETAFQAALTHRIKHLSPELALADSEARKFLKQTKHVLKGELGHQWNPLWVETGLPSSSIATPVRQDEREALVERMASFLKSHPGFENEKLGVTAKRGGELHRRMTTLRSKVKEQKSNERVLSMEREGCRQALRKRIRGVFDELRQLLPADDQRWHVFGQKPPAVRAAERKAARHARKVAEAGVSSSSGKEQPMSSSIALKAA